VVDLGAIGYDTVDKPEGLALIDENTLAVINDNDFGTGGVFDPATGLHRGESEPDAGRAGHRAPGGERAGCQR
jgi:hypothetical protein